MSWLLSSSTDEFREAERQWRCDPTWERDDPAWDWRDPAWDRDDTDNEDGDEA